jgi:hypothetical protein
MFSTGERIACRQDAARRYVAAQSVRGLAVSIRRGIVERPRQCKRREFDQVETLETDDV